MKSTRGRNPSPKPTLVPAIPLDEAKISRAFDAHREDAAKAALVVTERNDRVTALAAQLQYQGATDPSTLENSAREAIRRIGMGIFELGAYLLLMRESCEHGAFLPALERLGLDTTAAQRYMRVTRRFAANAASTPLLEGVGVTKLVELLPLDDEQLEDLTELGQTGELKLDDVASMSVKKLREKVRELRQDCESTAAVLDKRNKRIDKLEREVAHFERAKPDEKLVELQTAANRLVSELVCGIRGQLRKAVSELCEAAGTRSVNDPFVAGLVGQVQKELTELRRETGIPELGVDEEPEFSKALKSGKA